MPRRAGPLTLRRISLVHAHGLRLLGADVVLQGREEVGAMPGFPPPARYIVSGIRYAWAHRRPLVGAVLRPQDNVLSYALVVGVRLTGDATGAFEYADVRYTAGGNAYTLDTTEGLRLPPASGRC